MSPLPSLLMRGSAHMVVADSHHRDLCGLRGARAVDTGMAARAARASCGADPGTARRRGCPHCCRPSKTSAPCCRRAATATAHGAPRHPPGRWRRSGLHGHRRGHGRGVAQLTSVVRAPAEHPGGARRSLRYWRAPAAMECNLCPLQAPLRATGEVRSTVVPSPSWPSELRPQQNRPVRRVDGAGVNQPTLTATTRQPPGLRYHRPRPARWTTHSHRCPGRPHPSRRRGRPW